MRKLKQAHSLTMRTVAGAILTAILVSLVVVVFLFNQNRAGDIGFTGYVPASESPSLIVKDARLALMRASSGSEEHFDYVLTFKNTDMALYERKSDVSPLLECEQTAHPVDSIDYQSECNMAVLDAGGTVKAQQDYYKDKLFSVQVQAIIKGTSFNVSIPEDEVDTYSTYDWRAFFNSMEQVNLRGERYTVVEATHDGFG